MTRLFRKQVFITILPVLTLAALTAVWITRLSERQMLKQLADELTIESKYQAGTLSHFIAQRLAELNTLAASPLVKSGDVAALEYLFSEEQRLAGQFEGLFYNDVDGTVHHKDMKPFSVVDRAYFPQVQRGETVVTHLAESRATQHEIVLIIVPIKNNNQRVGALGGAIDIAALLRRVEAAVPSSEGFAALVGEDNRVLTLERPAAGAMRDDFAQWIKESTMGGVAKLGGKDYLLQQQAVDGTPWRLVMAKERTVVVQPIVTIRYLSLTISGFVLIAAFILAYFSTRRLLSPMGQLLAVHRRFGEGDWDARAEKLPKDEFGELGQAFNRTAQQVKERYDAQMTAEQHARYSEARFRLFAENIADAIYLYDIDGRIYDVNPAACRSLGYEYHELIERSIFEVVSSANEESLRRVWRGLITGEHATPLQREARHRRQDGSEFPVEISVVSLQTPDGPLFLGSARDISERKQAEEQLVKLDAKLREVQRVESIGILAGGIAHDFNNLLTGMLGFTRLAQPEAEHQPALKSYLQQIELSALRAAELCQQLLAYAGKGRFVIETIDLSELVRDTAGLIESILKDGSSLQLELAADLPRIEGDATQIRQVVMNLITNASDALEGHAGTVTVRTGFCQLDDTWLQAAYSGTDAAVGPHVFVEVRDTGVGMSQETLAKVFDPFFTTKFTGRGLGLAAVLGIVRGHRGAVRIFSEVGKGSTFVVAFPPCEELMENSTELPSTNCPTPSAAARRGDAVLVIDDDASVRALALKALEGNGLRVLLAKDGAEGLELFHAHHTDLAAVVVDLTMPGMSGRDVLRAMRAVDAKLPLLAMSGYFDFSLETESAELDLAGFVAKPFRLSALADAVNRSLGVCE